MAQTWHLSHYKFHPLALALPLALSENLQFPSHMTAIVPVKSFLLLALCSQLLQPNFHGVGLSLFAIFFFFFAILMVYLFLDAIIRKQKLNFYYTVESKYHFPSSKYHHWINCINFHSRSITQCTLRLRND